MKTPTMKDAISSFHSLKLATLQQWSKALGKLKFVLMPSVVEGHHEIAVVVKGFRDFKKDPLARSLKNKSFPFYNDWKEIFGKDRATGENSQTFADTVQNLLNKEGLCDPSTGEDQAPKTSHFNSGLQADFQSDLRAESSSGTKSMGKKRKMHVENDKRFIEAINLFSEKSDSRFSEMSLQMANLAQHVGSAYEILQKKGISL
ncbi:hypothetical protein ACS0TY_034843 [Phlomoides rotata]